MSPTRRQFLLTSTGGITALAGCSVLSDPQQSLLVGVSNYTEARHQFHLLVEHDGTELVRQSLDVVAGEPNAWPTMKTTIALGEMPDGTRLNVTAWVADGSKANTSVTLDCSDEYSGDAVGARIDNPDVVELNGDNDGNTCYGGEFSETTDSAWATNQSKP